MEIKTKFNIGDEVCHINDVLEPEVQFDVIHDIIVNSLGVFYNCVPEGYDLLDDTLDLVPEADLIAKERVAYLRKAIRALVKKEIAA